MVNLGIGATHMYGMAQPRIVGVPCELRGAWKQAIDLSRRLVTLPILSSVNAGAIPTVLTKT
jgi:hypothetical protein